jgi:hypothetical protein
MPRALNNRWTVPLALGGSAYIVLCWLLAAEIPLVPPATPRWIVVVMLTVVGPAAFFAAAADMWRWFVGSVAVIGVCLGFARRLARTQPESDTFMWPLLLAGMVWIVSG